MAQHTPDLTPAYPSPPFSPGLLHFSRLVFYFHAHCFPFLFCFPLFSLFILSSSMLMPMPWTAPQVRLILFLYSRFAHAQRRLFSITCEGTCRLRIRPGSTRREVFPRLYAPFSSSCLVVLRFSFFSFRPLFRLFALVVDADTVDCSPRFVLFSIDSPTRHPGPARVGLLLVGPCTISVLDIPQCYLFVVHAFCYVP